MACVSLGGWLGWYHNCVAILAQEQYRYHFNPPHFSNVRGSHPPSFNGSLFSTNSVVLEALSPDILSFEKRGMVWDLPQIDPAHHFRLTAAFVKTKRNACVTLARQCMHEEWLVRTGSEWNTNTLGELFL